MKCKSFVVAYSFIGDGVACIKHSSLAPQQTKLVGKSRNKFHSKNPCLVKVCFWFAFRVFCLGLKWIIFMEKNENALKLTSYFYHEVAPFPTWLPSCVCCLPWKGFRIENWLKWKAPLDNGRAKAYAKRTEILNQWFLPKNDDGMQGKLENWK